MRKVVVSTFLSLDGVMQSPGGPEEDPTDGFTHGGWTFNYWDESMGRFMDEAFSDPFDLLLGRRTYDIFAGHWPFVEGGDPTAERFNAATKYVATSSSEPFTWTNSVALRGDVAAEIARLKQEDGPNLLVQGSSQLIQTLLANDLVDELYLLIFPIVLGSGKRLFGQGAIPTGLKLLNTAVSTTGVMMGAYRRAEAAPTGSFALKQPTAIELARREKMKREAASPTS